MYLIKRCCTLSIGTVHGRMQGEPKLDFQRLQKINEKLGIPLFIHGGTGLSDEQFRQLIDNGVSKINYYTSLAGIAGMRIRENVTTSNKYGYTGLTTGIKDSIDFEVERCIRLWGSADRADELLALCTPWTPVEHVIIYNVDGITDHQATAMMRKGQEILGTIPGVREVNTGKAITSDAYILLYMVNSFLPQRCNRQLPKSS